MKATCVCAVKGGVGKTLISLNLAYQLKQKGMKVGLIDADIDNPNFASFTNAPPDTQIDVQNKKFVPYEWEGIKVFSMSLIAGRDKGISQSADRYEQILADVVEDTNWGDVDVFVVDNPAGSGNVFRASMEIFAEHLVGNVIVSQPLLLDATKRVINLHRYFEIPILGVVENMSEFRCEHGQVYHPFGRGKTKELCDELGLPFAGSIPLSLEISKGVEVGDPIIKGEGREVIEALAEKVIQTPVQKTGLLERLKKALDLGRVKVLMEKLIAQLLISVHREFNIGQIRLEKGFTEKRPFLLVLTDDSGTKEILRVALRVTEEGIKVIKEPKDVDFEVATSFRTFARMVMGKRKVGDQVVPAEPIDFWLSGDVQVFGKGFTPRTVEVLNKIFKDENLMGAVREKYGKILEGWI
jgi:Mrp family chromosome partitioning ATPase